MGESALAALLRRRRLQLRLTQREAARRAGVSLATWQSLERREPEGRGYRELTLARVADGLELLERDVFAAAGKEAPVTDSPTPREPGQETPESAAPERLVSELSALLLRLANQSETDFLLVYGQALEAADHLLQRNRHEAASGGE